MKLKYLLHFFIALVISGAILAVGSLTRVTNVTNFIYIFIGSVYLGYSILKKPILWGLVFAFVLTFVIIPLYHYLFDVQIFILTMECNADKTICHPISPYIAETGGHHLVLGALGAFLGSKLKKLLKK